MRDEKAEIIGKSTYSEIFKKYFHIITAKYFPVLGCKMIIYVKENSLAP